MSVPKHLEEAVARLKQAQSMIDLARGKPASVEAQRDWLIGLTDYVKALCDIQEYNSESIHEKLHELVARVGLRHFPGTGPAS